MGKLNKIDRISFSKIPEQYEPPFLIEMQIESYEWFLQRNVDPDERKNYGLQELFNEIFPIDYSKARKTEEEEEEGIVLEFMYYILGEPKFSEQEARDRDTTYSAPLKVRIRLINKRTGEIKEQEVYFGDIPLMTKDATFIVNGAERVIVSQLHRSPGLNFDDDDGKRHPQGRKLYSARVNPYRGSWVEFEFDVSGALYVKLDKKKKISAFTFLRTWGFDSDVDVLKCFCPIQEYELPQQGHEIDPLISQQIMGKRLILNDELVTLLQKAKNEENKEEIVYIEKLRLAPITGEILEDLQKRSITKLHIFLGGDEYKPVLETLLRDTSMSVMEALRVVFEVFRPGDLGPDDIVRTEFNRRFKDPKYYDLGTVGRYKLNKRLGITNERESDRLLTKEDVIEVIKMLFKLEQTQGKSDDTDHLGNRRIRSVGELLQSHLRTAFMKMERSVRDKLSILDQDTATPQSLINIKPITAALREFFGTSQLSQFMDQTNPLAALTHKRRLSALGPGGLQRERAMFDVRDVHRTHYGRICPIETPEGPNIGLIVSLSTYAKPNNYGFLETPYRRVINGKVTNEVVYLNAAEEDGYKIAQATTEVDSQGKFVEDKILVRYGESGEEYIYVLPEEVDFIDLSPKQIVSVSTALIPFLEHDDANRALMGSNMQRQAVPLLKCEPAIVGTGIERKIAIDSGAVIVASESGTVVKTSADEIIIRDKNGFDHRYELPKFKRSNQNTAINYKPIVIDGEKVEKGEPIADGPGTSHGELALGRDVFVAFMPWHGFNFEDAIVLSERLVRDDVYTSVHIEKFEIEVRDTKLGRENITKDIPGISEQALEALNEDGIVKLGTRVKPGDILVGKVTPKGESDVSPEFKLLHSIFGEKAKNVKDTSLRVPHGSGGIVIDIKRFSREDGGGELGPGIEELVKVFLATKKKISVGDKIAGRHGNKGVISIILPVEDMPYLEDGTPVDVVLNPLSVPSRMNIGQIFETHLGWAASKLEFYASCPPFNGATENETRFHLANAGLPPDGKVILYDGKTGEPFENKVTVGIMYIMKLNHLIDDKMHARSTGPYSLVTQQPLGGKSQFGGQRMGEMEVWALEAYGASYTLQELLTVKSDDVSGRANIYQALVKGQNASPPGIPESFNVLVRELQGLALDIQVYNEEGDEIDIKNVEEQQDVLSKAKSVIKGKR
ncbi:MAG: DNA-directed RNA polymerase subunit beta [Candidatus Hydrogenedentota bacterium]